MTHDGPGDDDWVTRGIRDGQRRREFEQSLYRPDPEHSTPRDEDIAFQDWKRKKGYND